VDIEQAILWPGRLELAYPYLLINRKNNQKP